MRRAALLVFVVVSLLYLAFPTQDYYWDGVFFAQIIEEDPGGLWYLHPNHLLYNPLGRALWLGMNAAGLHVRALTALQIFSSLAGAAAVAVFFCILLELETSVYSAICLSGAFAVSATWWKFATDANSYIPSILLLLFCVQALVRRAGGRFALAGLMHSGAMLLHELAILFYPAGVLMAWSRTEGRPRTERLKAVALYTLAAALPTGVTYGLAFAARNEHFAPGEFLGWVASSSPDAMFSFALGKNLITSIVGHVRLLVGGSMRAVMQQRSPVSAVAALGVVTILLILARRFVQQPPKPAAMPDALRRLLPALALWWGTYALFLLVWLPHNTFYRLFYLPALFLGAACLVQGVKSRYNRLALCVAALFLANFGFYIYPQSRPGSNPAVAIAQEMRSIWKPGEVVYWDVYAADNRTIRYFSPQIEWRELWGRAYINLLEDSFAHSKGVWFDSVALEDFRRRDPAFAAWLNEHIRIEETYQFPVGGHVVGFAMLVKK